MLAPRWTGLLVLCCQAYLAIAQTFSRRYDVWDQLRSETGFGIELTNDGYLLFAGAQFEDSLVYSSVVSTLRLDLNAVPIDSARVVYPLHATYPGWADVAFPIPGGFAVGGSTYAQDGTQRPALYFFDSSGTPLSFMEYGVAGEEWIGRQGKRAADGGLVICGETSSSGIIDAFLIKTDSLGNQEWVQTYGGAIFREYVVSVDIAPDGGYYLGGQRGYTPSNYDQMVLRVDSVGGVVWDNTYGTSFNDYPLAQITTTSNGDCLIASHEASNNFGYGRLSLARIDPAGSITWSQTYDSVNFSPVFFVAKELNAGGDIIAAGQTHLPGYMQGALLRTDAAGDSLWLRYYHYFDSLWTEGRGGYKDVLPTPDGGFIAVGTAYGSNNPDDPPIYSQDTWVVKVDSMGCLVPGCDTVTGIVSQVTNLRDALTIAPNPAREKVVLTWKLPERFMKPARLTIVNTTGAWMHEGPIDLGAGRHQVDVNGYPAGMYYLHVVQEGTWITGAKVLVE